jgi:hypothetical protein
MADGKTTTGAGRIGRGGGARLVAVLEIRVARKYVYPKGFPWIPSTQVFRVF